MFLINIGPENAKDSKSTKHGTHGKYKGETNTLKKEYFENLQGKLKMCVRDCV